MRTVPIHWLLIVCFFAVPVSHGQATRQTGERVPAVRVELAASLALWRGTRRPPCHGSDRANVYPVLSRHGSASLGVTGGYAIVEDAGLSPRGSEVLTAQPAGP